MRGGREGRVSLCCRQKRVRRVMENWEKHKSPDYSCEMVENCPFRGEEKRPGVKKIDIKGIKERRCVML